MKKIYQKEWEEFKNQNIDVFATDNESIIEMIDQFMMHDNIDINKFAANYLIFKNGSREIYSASSKLNNEPDLSEDGTSTIEWMVDILHQPLGYPSWFMAAYPDVVKYVSDFDEEKMKLFIDDFIEDCMGNNNKFKLSFLRRIVDVYINDGNILEVT